MLNSMKISGLKTTSGITLTSLAMAVVAVVVFSLPDEALAQEGTRQMAIIRENSPLQISV